MRWWRIYHRRFTDPLSGEGARRYGGRWNYKGQPVLYLAGSPALAMAEKLVQAPPALYASGFLAAEIEIDARYLPAFAANELPEGWDAQPFTSASQTFGHEQLIVHASLGFRVPSVVVPLEENAVIGTGHLYFARRVRLIRDSIPFPFDRRLLSN